MYYGSCRRCAGRILAGAADERGLILEKMTEQMKVIFIFHENWNRLGDTQFIFMAYMLMDD
jgi:hypothetical protein